MSSEFAQCATCLPVRPAWRERVARTLRPLLSACSWDTLPTSGYVDFLLSGQIAAAYEAESRGNDARETREALIAREAAQSGARR